jgi:hypothetical protein
MKSKWNKKKLARFRRLVIRACLIGLTPQERKELDDLQTARRDAYGIV